MAALWAGQEGSYLFWGWLLFLLALVFMRGGGWGSVFHRRVLGVVLVFGAGLLVTTVGLSPFVSIYQVEPDIPAGMVPRNGAGLNPLLRTPWMVVHPPVIFLSFSAMAFVFGAGVARLWWGCEEWERSTRVWARVSWVLLGLAVALGGLWS
ncbi:MAG: cytochrome c biogenesis protein CcsA, partial [Euryarchaeota archaeon]|nr:cytochrome c biogenesis protein CcsA [Euryarchaeota archaeon]